MRNPVPKMAAARSRTRSVSGASKNPGNGTCRAAEKHALVVDSTVSEPLGLSVAETSRVTGLSRTVIYRALGSGELEAKKAGAHTLITFASIKRYWASLPNADIRYRS